MARREPIVIDLSTVKTANQLHQELSNGLDFPGWYGMNWDAFWDAITALVEMPKKLRLIGWAGLAERLPQDMEIMKQCLEAMAKKYPELASKIEYV